MRALLSRTRGWAAGSLLGTLLCAGLAMPTPATAAECMVVAQTIGQLQSAVTAGAALLQRLEESGAEIAIVGRIGSDQSKRGLRYTHAGLAWSDHPGGSWHFIHMLNHCGRSSSQLFDDGPVDFFLERPFRYDAWVVIPSPELQRAIVTRLRQGADSALHDPNYNAIANPFRTRYQNSNQWLLELIAVALDPSGPATRAHAQSILRQMNFEPERIKLGFFERVGTHRMGNVSMKDHSRRERREGGFTYVSVRSVARFLEQHGLAEQSFEIPATADS